MNDSTAINDTFEQTVKDLAGYIYTLSYRLTGSPEEANDLMQETFLKAYQGWGTLKNAANPLPWMRKICVNCFIDAYRKPSKKLIMKETEFPSDRHEIASENLSPEDEIICDEEVRRISSQCYTVLSTSLTVPQRISFVLIDVFSVELDEVSRLIGRTPVATKSLLHRARKKMNRFLSPHCGLVSADNLCRCRSWIGLSHDVQKRRELLRSILHRNSSKKPDAATTSRTIREIYHALPYLHEPAEGLKEFFRKL